MSDCIEDHFLSLHFRKAKKPKKRPFVYKYENRLNQIENLLFYHANIRSQDHHYEWNEEEQRYMIDFGLEHYFLEGDPMNTHSKSSMEDFHPVLVIPVCNRIASLIKILLKLVTQKYYSLFDVYISLGCSVSIKDVYVHVVYIFV